MHEHDERADEKVYDEIQRDGADGRYGHDGAYCDEPPDEPAGSICRKIRTVALAAVNRFGVDRGCDGSGRSAC